MDVTLRLKVTVHSNNAHADSHVNAVKNWLTVLSRSVQLGKPDVSDSGIQIAFTKALKVGTRTSVGDGHDVQSYVELLDQPTIEPASAGPFSRKKTAK